ncbi:MAG: murein biosynthesis integral membrane protein MurJ [Spirochaetales bacterium]|nr:murein biosynthesis integral membrane protein MurJ [Spirochaetales bacterium]
MENRGERAKKNSIVVMIFTFISRVVGIFKARVIATVFGATVVGDLLNFTFNIPNNFRKLFAEGALSSAYIPRFSTLIAEDESGERSKGLLKVMNAFQLLIALLLIGGVLLFGSQFIRFISDYSDPSLVNLAAKLLFFFTIFLSAISFAALWSGVLQSHGSFLVAAAAPLLFSLAIIGAVKVTEGLLGPFSMALGVVVGGVLQALVVWLALRRHSYKLRLSFNFKNSDFLAVLKAWLPVTLIALTTILTQQVSYFFASALPEGSVTALSNAIIIWQAPYGIFYGAIATVYFPLIASAPRDEVKTVISKGLAYLVVFLVPVTITLVTLRNETVAVLLQSGLFKLKDTLLTGSILLYFALGIPLVSWYSFLQRGCYSLGKYRAALYFNLTVAAIDILAMVTLIKWVGWGVWALSLANTIAFGVGALLLSIYLALNNFFKVDKEVLKVVLANLPLLAVALLYSRLADPAWWHGGSSWGNVLKLTLLYGGAVLLTLVIYLLMGIKVLPSRRRGPQSTRH